MPTAGYLPKREALWGVRGCFQGASASPSVPKLSLVTRYTWHGRGLSGRAPSTRFLVRLQVPALAGRLRTIRPRCLVYEKATRWASQVVFQTAGLVMAREGCGADTQDRARPRPSTQTSEIFMIREVRSQ